MKTPDLDGALKKLDELHALMTKMGKLADKLHERIISLEVDSELYKGLLSNLFRRNGVSEEEMGALLKEIVSEIDHPEASIFCGNEEEIKEKMKELGGKKGHADFLKTLVKDMPDEIFKAVFEDAPPHIQQMVAEIRKAG